MEMIRQRVRFVHDESLSRLEDEFYGQKNEHGKELSNNE